MEHHPVKFCADLSCLAATLLTITGWLPTFLACAASIMAALYYGLAVWDRLKKGKSHEQPNPGRRSTD